ncbi:MAG: hypothetical protein AAFR62_16555 [Cyanobacteria bacterium J06629_2]
MSQFPQDAPKIDDREIREVVDMLSKISSRSPEEVKPYLDELLSRLSREPSTHDRHFFNTATDDEWLASFKEWSQSHKSQNLPVLSDEAMSRDNIYNQRG